MNETLKLDAAEAEAESPALLKPRTGLSIHAVVGAAERPELMRQTRLLAEAWHHAGADVADAYLAGGRPLLHRRGVCRSPKAGW